MIVGALVTHNTRQDDLVRAVASLRAVSDDVIAFDDASSDDTFDRLRRLGVSARRSAKSNPKMLVVMRAMLYAEAERRGADWMVYHDDDEAMSPSLQRSLPSLLPSLPENAVSVECMTVHFWGDERHSRVIRDAERIAWRANRGYSYYSAIQNVFEGVGGDMDAWHVHRPPPIAALRDHSDFRRWALPEDQVLLHYANSSRERTEARRAWSASTGLKNSLNDDPFPGDIIEIPDPAPWS